MEETNVTPSKGARAMQRANRTYEEKAEELGLEQYDEVDLFEPAQKTYLLALSKGTPTPTARTKADITSFDLLRWRQDPIFRTWEAISRSHNDYGEDLARRLAKATKPAAMMTLISGMETSDVGSEMSRKFANDILKYDYEPEPAIKVPVPAGVDQFEFAMRWQKRES